MMYAILKTFISLIVRIYLISIYLQKYIQYLILIFQNLVEA